MNRNTFYSLMENDYTLRDSTRLMEMIKFPEGSSGLKPETHATRFVRQKKTQVKRGIRQATNFVKDRMEHPHKLNQDFADVVKGGDEKLGHLSDWAKDNGHIIGAATAIPAFGLGVHLGKKGAMAHMKQYIPHAAAAGAGLFALGRMSKDDDRR